MHCVWAGEKESLLRGAVGEREVRKFDYGDTKNGAIALNAQFNLNCKQRQQLARRAANGNSGAAFRLFKYYKQIADDRIESVFWLRMAAGHHHGLAEYELAYMLLHLGSFGLSHSIEDRDVQRAKYWFLRAKRDGDQEAGKRLKEIEVIEQEGNEGVGPTY